MWSGVLLSRQVISLSLDRDPAIKERLHNLSVPSMARGSRFSRKYALKLFMPQHEYLMNCEAREAAREGSPAAYASYQPMVPAFEAEFAH